MAATIGTQQMQALQAAHGGAAVQPCPSKAPTTGVIHLECDPTWDPCQKEQARAKTRALDDLAKKNGGLVRQKTAGRRRDRGNTWAAKFRSDFDRAAAGSAPSALKFTAAPGPTATAADFAAPCVHNQWVAGGRKGSGGVPLRDCSPDHVRDLQWGGNVQGPLKWMDREVNEKLGADMKAGANGPIDVATGFQINCP